MSGEKKFENIADGLEEACGADVAAFAEVLTGVDDHDFKRM